MNNVVIRFNPNDAGDRGLITSQSVQVSTNQSNVEQDKDEWGNFNGLEDKKIRSTFIRKVYLILLIQLSITFGLIAIVIFIPSIHLYIRSSEGYWLYFTSYITFLVTYFALSCSKTAARTFPINLIFLSIVTLSMSYMMAMISAYYEIESVLIAIGITVFVFIGITLFSFQTKYDLTSCFGILFVMLLVLLCCGIVCIFTLSRIMFTIYAGLGAAFFSIFLVIDTQLIMGGRRHEINPEDHVYASLMLYIDIAHIFIYVLALFEGLAKMAVNDTFLIYIISRENIYELFVHRFIP
ncbi:unnamed protein product [Rotaria magnacalcarata]|uniref:Uncharacterized protein n=3 Tax=Rotaria magnacalcarata TaxID=392030 RepID=A0A8S2JXB2_9BILA|nr:unnamed protein product [Rotaria magnacalcarata]